jgi:hypothetical protein
MLKQQTATSVLGLPDPEDKDTIILRKAENYSANNKASQSCRLEHILYKILAGQKYYDPMFGMCDGAV